MSWEVKDLTSRFAPIRDGHVDFNNDEGLIEELLLLDCRSPLAASHRFPIPAQRPAVDAATARLRRESANDRCMY
jgi:hypothetical protein